MICVSQNMWRILFSSVKLFLWLLNLEVNVRNRAKCVFVTGLVYCVRAWENL